MTPFATDNMRPSSPIYEVYGRSFVGGRAIEMNMGTSRRVAEGESNFNFDYLYSNFRDLFSSLRMIQQPSDENEITARQ